MNARTGLAAAVLAAAAGLTASSCSTSNAPPAPATTVTVPPTGATGATGAAGSPNSGAAPASSAPAPAQSPTRAPAPTVTRTATVPAPAAPASSAAFTNAAAVVEQYYQDINDQDYAAAWALGGKNIAGPSYSAYVRGFDTTASVSLGTISEFGSGRVQAYLYATQTDGTVKTFQGTYTVSGGEIVAADIKQTG